MKLNVIFILLAATSVAANKLQSPQWWSKQDQIISLGKQVNSKVAANVYANTADY